MLEQRHQRLVVMAGVVALLFLACTIEEDLRINADGSGTYRVKISIPKQLGEGFGDFRKEAEKDGFTVEREGETEQERFILLRKNFSDVASLNDSHGRFELTTTDTGILRREYRLRATLQAVGFGSYKRRLLITMPGEVQSTSAGERSGSRVTWDGHQGGTIEVVASGFHLPVSSNQKLAFLTIAAGGLLFLAMRRRRRVPVPEA